MKRLLAALALFLAGLFVQSALGSGAAAQTGTPCMIEVTNGCLFSIWAEGPCPGWFNCFGVGALFAICQAMTSACPPAAAPQETCASCVSGVASSPISLASGNTFIKETDIRLPGLSGGLTLERTWNSLWPSTQTAFQVGLFGPNWRSNFEERVFVGSDNYIKYARGDGSFWSFGVGGPQWSVAAPANAGATLVMGSSYWTMTFQNGEQRLFDNTSGNLIAIIDRNGNTTQLSYNSVGFLATVTDPVSRTLSFTYGNSSFPALVTSVTSSAGITVSYSYDTQGRLTQVTEPDGSTYNFQYNTQSLISAVVDSQGVVLESHTYDSSGRGLTSSRANGVEAVSITYPN
jgi:YD repeat-containing protein